MLTVKKLLNGYDESMQFKKEVTPELLTNLQKTADIINEFLIHVGVREDQVKLTSGWRPLAVNEATANSAKKSNHILGLAVDLKDPFNNLFNAFMKEENLSKAKELGLYFENPRHTSTWVHIQIVAPKSGNRVFLASSAPDSNKNFTRNVKCDIYDINRRWS